WSHTAGGEGWGVRGEPLWGFKDGRGWWAGMAKGAPPFDGQTIARFFRHEQLSEIVCDDAHGKSIDFRHIRAQSFRLSCPRIGGEGCHHCSNEAGPADAQRAPRRYKRRSACIN